MIKLKAEKFEIEEVLKTIPNKKKEHKNDDDDIWIDEIIDEVYRFYGKYRRNKYLITKLFYLILQIYTDCDDNDNKKRLLKLIDILNRKLKELAMKG